MGDRKHTTFSQAFTEEAVRLMEPSGRPAVLLALLVPGLFAVGKRIVVPKGDADGETHRGGFHVG